MFCERFISYAQWSKVDIVNSDINHIPPRVLPQSPAFDKRSAVFDTAVYRYALY